MSAHELRNRLAEELKSESDRGCAILAVCLLEEALASAFSKVLPGGISSAKKFMPRGRLSTGVSNAATLGLIGEPTLSNLKEILDIRNVFAHGLLSGLTFDSPEILAKVNQLELPDLQNVSSATRDELSASARRRFMVAVDDAFFALDWLARVAKPYPIYAPLKSYMAEI